MCSSQATTHLHFYLCFSRSNTQHASGSALREAKCINKSLSSLSDVLGAIGEKRSHVPYRNSILTHLLQSSIGTSSHSRSDAMLALSHVLSRGVTFQVVTQRCFCWSRFRPRASSQLRHCKRCRLAYVHGRSSEAPQQQRNERTRCRCLCSDHWADARVRVCVSLSPNQSQ